MIESNETIAISLGGSIIYPDTGLNEQFLVEFNTLIRKQIAETNRRFFILVGAGHIGREYQYAGQVLVGNLSPDDIDWLEIHGTRLNGHLLRTILRDIAYQYVVSEFDKPITAYDKRIIVCAGWKPRSSTDYDMALLSKKNGIKQAIALTKVDKIYEKDPSVFPKARTFDHLTWQEYLDLIGDWREPLRSIPFDPLAAKLASRINLTVYFMNGTRLGNLERLLQGKPFDGTTVSNTKP